MVRHRTSLKVHRLKKNRNPCFLDGREHPPMHRSGQILFLPPRQVKTKGENECRSSFVFKAVMYM
ncbi:hypothetical protein COF63_06320 [Bacillus pseudomycoides]|nr:hypothetical protein CON86_24050 [Bacillus pseudomycoides]PEM75913.1 hypothetical protein CN632_13770 [Bacillus pseudomycoides]PHC88537.1 hypothetical protein COF63_06320 [Bacillus pseudomycoides]